MMIRSRLPADADVEKQRNALKEGASSLLSSNRIIDPPRLVQNILRALYLC